MHNELSGSKNAPIFLTKDDGKSSVSPTLTVQAVTLVVSWGLPNIMNSVTEFQIMRRHPFPYVLDTLLKTIHGLLTFFWLECRVELCIISIQVDVDVVFLCDLCE